MDNTLESETTSSTLQIPSADVIRLIQAHLTEQGLHESCACLMRETGIGSAALPSGVNLESWAQSGQWGLVLQQLAKVDRKRAQLDEPLLHQVHQAAILELADQNEWELAYAAFRQVQSDLEASKQGKETRAAFISRKLNELAVLRNKDKECEVPSDYYGTKSLDELRRELGAKLKEDVPVQPQNRLISLLQQAVKWQTYTGDLPRRQEAEGAESRKKRKVFDLVRGASYADPIIVGTALPLSQQLDEPIVQRKWQKLKFAKNSVVGAAAFYPDGSALVVGTSDGFIEIYEGPGFKALKSLPYQMNDECLTIEGSVTAVAVNRDSTLLSVGSSDGALGIFNLGNGQCLRQFKCFDNHVTCLDFSMDSSHVLASGPTGVREFGLRSNRILRDLSTPASVIHCIYWHDNIIVGCNDGIVRLYRNSDRLATWNPQAAAVGGSVSIDAGLAESSTITTSPAILALIPIRARDKEEDNGSMLVVSRSEQACLVLSSGKVALVFKASSEIVAATVSPSHRLLYLAHEDSVSVFDLQSGDELRKIDMDLQAAAMVHHPIKAVLATFSSDTAQKRGLLQLWK